jgi:two-component system sensor histidine kinase KdpD
MKTLLKHAYRKLNQYLFSVGSVLLSAGVSYIAIPFIGYRTAALILLVNVSVLAMLFDIMPVMVASTLSALIWNYFFIPPIHTFHIDNTEDLLMFLMYFFIASVNAVLTFKIRKEEEKVRDKEEKEKIIKLYNTLLNSLSHELRTPISAIIGSVDALKDNREIISVKNQDELLNQISIAGLRLNTHVENLLNMNRLETGILKLNLDWCDMNELVLSVIDNLPLPHQQVISFEPNEYLPYFKLDRGIIEQVILNLITNAVCHTPANSKIHLFVFQKEDFCVIKVQDNGPGLPNHEIEHLFDKFYRGSQTKTGGLGIGLSIVKGFIEAHDGMVILENNQPSGLVFTIQFPAEQSYLKNLKNE